MALSATEMALEDLPRFAIYNWFTPRGRQREVLQTPAKTFRLVPREQGRAMSASRDMILAAARANAPGQR